MSYSSVLACVTPWGRSIVKNLTNNLSCIGYVFGVGHIVDLRYRGIWANERITACWYNSLDVNRYRGSGRPRRTLVSYCSCSWGDSLPFNPHPPLTPYLNIRRIVTSHSPQLSSMFTVGLNFVKITSLNAATLTAQLVRAPSTPVSEMWICGVKLTDCSTK